MGLKYMIEKVVAARKGVDPRVRAVANFMVGDLVGMPGLKRAVEVVAVGLDHGHDGGSHSAECFTPKHVVYTVRLRETRPEEFLKIWHSAELHMVRPFEISITPGYRF